MVCVCACVFCMNKYDSSLIVFQNVSARGKPIDWGYKLGSHGCTYTHTHTLLPHNSRNTWKEGGEISTNPNMPQCSRPSKGVAARTLGLANHGRRSICCPIRASGTSGTNEQQLNSDLSHLASQAALFHSFSSPLNLLLHLSITGIDELFVLVALLYTCTGSSAYHGESRHSSFMSQLSPVSRMQEGRQGYVWYLYPNNTLPDLYTTFTVDVCVCSKGGHLSIYGVGKFNTVCFLAGVAAAL